MAACLFAIWWLLRLDARTMASCEPKRTSAYGEDPRWRMVWWREVLKLKLDDFLKNVNVDASTVHRTIQLFPVF